MVEDERALQECVEGISESREEAPKAVLPR